MLLHSFHVRPAHKTDLKLGSDKGDFELQELWLRLWQTSPIINHLKRINPQRFINISNLILSLFDLKLYFYTFKWFQYDLYLIPFEEFVFRIEESELKGCIDDFGSGFHG